MKSVIGDRDTLKKTEVLKQTQFQKVFRQGVRVRYQDYLGIYLENQSIFPRLGLAISRKLAQQAVRRNYEKRVIRETFRKHKRELPAVDLIVFLVRLPNVDFQLKQRQIRNLFRKVTERVHKSSIKN